MSNLFAAFLIASTRSICAALVGASAVIFAWPSSSQAASTFLGSANLDYAGPPYCSDPCLTLTYPSAGQVTVSVESGPDSFLHFDVQLATGFTFMDNHNTSFAFGLNIAGASITNITPTPSGGGTWTPQSNVAAGDGVGNTSIWPYGLLGTHKVSNELQFDVFKTGTKLTLANLIQTFDKHNVALWFIADVSNPLGKTGYVGATTSFISEEPIPTPLPVTLPLFATGFGVLSLLGWRRKRRDAADTPASLRSGQGA